MSNSKKPKLSEIRAREGAVSDNPLSNVGYLLDLVERLGKFLESYGKIHADGPEYSSKLCEKARALLKELEQ